MIDQVNQALSWLADVVMQGFQVVAAFFLQFFPDADSGILESIDMWGDSISGFNLTFNYFYFVNMPMVAAFFNVLVTILGAFIVYVFVKVTIEVVRNIVEIIPFVE